MQTDVIIPSNLIYPVRKVGHDVLMPGYETNSYNSSAIVVDLPTGGMKVVNNNSADYQLIRNSAILNPLIAGLSDIGPITVKGQSWKDAVFSMQVVVGKLLQPNGKAVKDSLHPELQILNSYNGKIRCSIRMGMFRVVCENGLSVPEEFMQWAEFSHTPMNEEDLAVAKILKHFEAFLGISDQVAGVYDDLKFMPVVNLENRVDEVIENTKFPVKLKEDVMDRIMFERAQGFKSTDWLVFNGFNYQLNHHEDLNWDPAKKVKTDHAILSFLSNS
jgi:hypothetical protein